MSTTDTLRSGSDAPALAVVELCRTYGTHRAVDDVSFEVRSNEVLGLLGPNGAGKTTITSMVMGVLAPTSGQILIEGIDLAARRSEALQRTNFTAVYAPLPGNLTVYQNLRVFAFLYDVKNREERIEALLDQLDLLRFREKKCGVLSSGEQARLGLAKAMLNHPKLLLLDEPTASLDPATAQEIRAIIRAFARDHTVGVLWTSHNMYEVEAVCDRVLFLSHGSILLRGDPRTLPGQHGKESLEELFLAVAREPLSLRVA